jgi:hypothetical protein
MAMVQMYMLSSGFEDERTNAGFETDSKDHSSLNIKKKKRFACRAWSMRALMHSGAKVQPLSSARLRKRWLVALILSQPAENPAAAEI